MGANLLVPGEQAGLGWAGWGGALYPLMAMEPRVGAANKALCVVRDTQVSLLRLHGPIQLTLSSTVGSLLDCLQKESD